MNLIMVPEVAKIVSNIDKIAVKKTNYKRSRAFVLLLTFLSLENEQIRTLLGNQGLWFKLDDQRKNQVF